MENDPRKNRNTWMVAVLWVVLMGYFSSGFLAPYAATTGGPPDVACGALLNGDHEQFSAHFRWFENQPRETWENSVVLRRLLYPLFIYPAVNTLGELWGGLVMNLLLTIFGLTLFYRFLLETISPYRARLGLLILASYPGIYYYLGLPYSYAAIFPITLISTIGMYRLFEKSSEISPFPISKLGKQLFGGKFLWAITLGICFVAYDVILLIWLPAVFFLAFFHYRANSSQGRSRIRWKGILHALVPPAFYCLCFLFPTWLNNLILRVGFNIRFENSNTQSYKNVLLAYFNPASENLAQWTDQILHLPKTLFETYLGSAFYVLPLFFLVVLGIKAFTKRDPGQSQGSDPFNNLSRIKWMAVAILLGGFSFWAITNIAPPMPGRWKLAGAWVARFYQPVFISYVLALIIWIKRDSVFQKFAMAVIIGQMTITLGQVVASPLTSWVYFSFYQHGAWSDYRTNVLRHGPKPLPLKCLGWKSYLPSTNSN